MSQAIPGGRPKRANSEGDILERDSCTSNSNTRSTTRLPSRSKTKLDLVRSQIYNETNQEHLPRKNKDFSHWQSLELERSSEDNSLLKGSASAHFESNSNTKSFVDDSDEESLKQSRTFFSFKSLRRAVKHHIGLSGDEIKNQNKSNFLKNTLTKSKLKPKVDADGFIAEKENNKRNMSSSSNSWGQLTEDTDPFTVPKWKYTPGTVGIYNHKNSCFMNAVLQCLSTTDSFAEYLIKDHYKEDLKISKSSKKVLRSGSSEVTEQLGKLFKSLWHGNYKSDISKDFKSTVGRFNSQYSGDHQHDAQEFLLWLLDKVHEDVSVQTKKKGKALKSPDLRSDVELASEAASVNGESFILKLFQALHSSTLTCPSCGEHSSTFDPYLCVSLPLPQICPRNIYVTMVGVECRSQEIVITLNQYETVKALREEISKVFDIPETELVLCKLTDEGFGITYHCEQPLSDIGEWDQVYCVEVYFVEPVQSAGQEFASPSALLLVVHVEIGGPETKRFASPCAIRVPRDLSWRSLQKEILNAMGDAVFEEILSHKLQNNLFDLKVYEEGNDCTYLDTDVEMPLYTQAIDRALSSLSPDFGPPHIKLLVEWNQHYKRRLVQNDEEEKDVHPSVNEARKGNMSQGAVSLDECLSLYTQEERLAGEDAWLCPHCKQQQQGTIKSLGLWSLPDVLVLHLKRFKQIGSHRSKLNTLVNFPIDDLNMFPHLIRNQYNDALPRDETTYELLGVCNHYGDMMGGHYTAFCRSPIDAKWREFNDDRVINLDPPICTKDAYILFYQRKSLSKDINYKRFTGNHWVFTLPLEKLNQKDDRNSKANNSNNNQSHSVRIAHSRSVSPTMRRKGNRCLSSSGISSRPLTPQPIKTKGIGSEDTRPASPPPPGYDLAARSKFIQKQQLESLSHKSKHMMPECIPNAKEYKEELSRDAEFLIQAGNMATISRIPLEKSQLHQTTALKRNTQHTDLIDSGGRHPFKSDSKHLSRIDSYRSISNQKFSRHNYQRQDSYLSNDSVTVEPASCLQVQLDPFVSTSTSSSNEENIDTKEARRRLAQLAVEHKQGLNTNDIPGEARKNVGVYKHQKSLEVANRFPIDIPDNYTSNNIDDTYRLHRRMDNDYNPRKLSSTVTNMKNHDCRPEQYQLNQTQFRRNCNELAQKHFGERSDHDMYKTTKRGSVRRGTFRHPNGNGAYIGKSVTMAIPQVTSSNHQSEKVPLSIPRSTTDYDVHYTGMDLGPPPSPTPPHSGREEHFASYSNIYPSISSHLYSHRSPQFSSLPTSFPSTEMDKYHNISNLPIYAQPEQPLYPTLRRKYTFRPLQPHVWNTVNSKTKPQKNEGIQSTCLRESSV